jgi:hypothetical protein
MGELMIMLLILSSIVLLFSTLLFSKNSLILESKIGVVSISIFVLLLTCISYTSFPSNCFLLIGLSLSLGGLGVVGIILSIYDKKLYKIGKILIVISIVSNFFMLIL